MIQIDSAASAWVPESRSLIRRQVELGFIPKVAVQKHLFMFIFNQAEEREDGSGHFEDYLTDDPDFLPDQEDDDYSDEEMSGEDVILEPSRGNVIRRVSLTLRRSWRPALASHASEEFSGLAANLSGALEGLYKRVPGKQTFTVVSFRWKVLSSLHCTISKQIKHLNVAFYLPCGSQNIFFRNKQINAGPRENVAEQMLVGQRERDVILQLLLRGGPRF